MYISTVWLKNILNLQNFNLKTITNKLTICGFEIEEQHIYKNLNKNDVILDLKTTTNRPDILSIVGLVEEFNVLLNAKVKNTKLKKTKVDFFKKYNNKITLEKSEINFPSTLAFILTKIENFNITEIQPWIKQRLLAAKIIPENNLNDLKHYLILEWGQPIFFYDFDKIKILTKNENPKISIRFAYKDEIFIDCFSKKYFLTNDTLVVIADNIIISIAGSLISNDCFVEKKTKNILVETSIYEPKSFRKSERSVGIRTEASVLFERGVNKFLIKSAYNRFFNIFEILNTISNTKIDSCFTFFKEKILLKKKINLSLENIEKIIFFNSDQKNHKSKKKIIQCLNQMRFRFIEENKNFFKVSIPFTRYSDIEEEIDLIEEITRIIGFNNFLSILPKTKKVGKISNYEIFKRKFRNAFINLGFVELFNFSLTSENKLVNKILIVNSLITEYSFLRTNLMFQILDSLEKNINQGNKLLPVFEFGRTYTKLDDNSLQEKDLICGVFCGSIYKISWAEKNFQLNWFQVKEFLESIFINLKLEYSFSINTEFLEHYNPKNSLSININNKKVGMFGKIHPKIAYKKNLPINCFLFELELTKIYKIQKIKNNIVYKHYSLYPSLSIDMSLLILKKINYQMIQEIIKNAGGSLLEKIELFDFYENLDLNSDFYSLGIKLSFRSLNKTLLRNEIDSILLEIENKLKNNLNIQFRN
jgi:phenylalanyl-tRNA synthetase beta chain